MRSYSPGSFANRKQGIALVVVLWMMTLLSILAASMSYSLRQESRLTANYVENAKAQALVEGGIYYGIQMLFEEDEERRWSKAGKSYEINLSGYGVLVFLQDERGKVNLNKAPEHLIQQIIESSEEQVDARAVTQAILDWRDKDDEPYPAGAEDDEYLHGQYAYGARDGAFLVVDELQQVMGVTAGLYEDIGDLLTVYSSNQGVDPSTAPIDVLARLPGMDGLLAGEFVQERDDVFADNKKSLMNRLPVETQAYLAQSGPAVYTVTARVQLPEGGHMVKSAVVHLTRNKNNPYTIIAWRNSS